MKQFISIRVFFLCFIFACSGSAVAADQAQQEIGSSTVSRPARAPEDQEQLGRRLSSVEKLIEQSSVARQIESSTNQQALAMRGQARDLRHQAQEAYRVGNLPEASRLLDQATKTLLDGARLAAPEKLGVDKKKRDFDSRLESVKALLAAQKRIGAEKKLGSKGAEDASRLDAQVAEAVALADAGKLDQGRLMLDKVYLTTKLVIENLREGDTLVRSLNFANKEEEYHYEIDRNDTHKMLVKVLLDEKRASNPNLEGIVAKYLEKAAAMRVDANKMADKKDFDSAVKLLEDSTKEIVRAIRGAGIYIPG